MKQAKAIPKLTSTALRGVNITQQVNLPPPQQTWAIILQWKKEWTETLSEKNPQLGQVTI